MTGLKNNALLVLFSLFTISIFSQEIRTKCSENISFEESQNNFTVYLAEKKINFAIPDKLIDFNSCKISVVCKNEYLNLIYTFNTGNDYKIVNTIFKIREGQYYWDKTFVQYANRNEILYTGFNGNNEKIEKFKIKNEEKYFLKVACDGESSESGTFSLKDIETKEVRTEKCLCKKDVFDEKDLKFIVAQFRKLEIRIIKNIDRHEGTNHKKWLDKNGDLIEDNDTGKKPKNAVIEKFVTKNLSMFDDLAGDNKIYKERLFTKNSNDLNIRESEKKYIEFAKQMKNVLKKFEINTCLRKIHFLSQIYHETQKLTTTYEAEPSSSVSGGDYYRGRGLLHLTHDYNYLEYYDYRNKTTFFKTYLIEREGYETLKHFNDRTENKFITVDEMKKFDDWVKLVSVDLFYACDTAGWYWWKNKINNYADKDDLINVSAIVNNPSAKDVKSSEGINGFDERKKYYDLVKVIFDYENCK